MIVILVPMVGRRVFLVGWWNVSVPVSVGFSVGFTDDLAVPFIVANIEVVVHRTRGTDDYF
jgi:hypothetical protein